jgi:hypothetical protein
MYRMKDRRNICIWIERFDDDALSDSVELYRQQDRLPRSEGPQQRTRNQASIFRIEKYKYESAWLSRY